MLVKYVCYKNSASLIRTFCHLTNFVGPLVKIPYKFATDMRAKILTFDGYEGSSILVIFLNVLNNFSSQSKSFHSLHKLPKIKVFSTILQNYDQVYLTNAASRTPSIYRLESHHFHVRKNC